MSLVASKPIKRGEELTINYEYDPVKYRNDYLKRRKT